MAIKKNAASGSVEWVKNNWLFLLGLFVVLPYVRAYFEKAAAKAQIDDEQNQVLVSSQINALNSPSIQLSKSDKILKNMPKAQKEKICAAVMLFVEHMGVEKPWWDHKYWSERDEKAAVILAAWVKNMPLFAKLYNEVYTKNRNLRTDFNNLMADSLQLRIRANQIKQGYPYF